MQKFKTAVCHARDLRTNPTRAEILIWSRLRQEQLGVKFRRQHPIDHYIVDFFCPARRLVVEIDGSQHNEDVDQAREQYLRDHNNPPTPTRLR